MNPSSLPKRPWVFAAFSLLTTVSIFAFLLSRVSIMEVLRIIRGADLRGVGLYLILSFSMSGFRTWRYQLLLGVRGYAPGNLPLFLTVLVRNFFSDLLPARLGTLIYVFITTTRLGIPFGPAASSFAVSFLFDLIALVPLILLAAVGLGLGQILPLGTTVLLSAILLLLVLGLLLALPALGRWAARLAGKWKRIPQSWATALRQAAKDLDATRRAGVYGRTLALSLAVRVTKYASMYFFLFALLVPLGYQLADLEPARIFTGLCAAELSASTPLSGIGGFGAYEGTWAYIFGLLGFPQHIANVTSVAHHLFTQVVGYSLGAAALLLLLLPHMKTPTQSPDYDHAEQQTSPFFWLKLLLSIVALVVSCQIGLQLPARGASSASGPVAAATPEEAALHRELTRDMGGTLYFDSNRSGSFGIWAMAPDGSRLRRIADDPERAEMYPDPHPRGGLVFARARSPHRDAPSEIWHCALDGSAPKRLSDNGTFPSWSADGSQVYFERERTQLIVHDLASGKEEPVKLPFKGKTVKPRISPDGLQILCMRDKPRGWHVWLSDHRVATPKDLGESCEGSWYPDSQHIVLISKIDAQAGSGIFKLNPDTAAREVLHDDGPPNGHEYFPRISADGNYLLFAACPAEQHDHTRAPYQLMLKDLNSGQCCRLTRDTFTNRWPVWLPALQ